MSCTKMLKVNSRGKPAKKSRGTDNRFSKNLKCLYWTFKFDLIFLIGNLILRIFCSMHFFDKIHCLWGNKVFWVFEFLFWNCKKTILVEDTLDLIAYFRKEIRFCIFFICDTFLILLTVYEIICFFKMAASIKWKFSFLHYLMFIIM